MKYPFDLTIFQIIFWLSCFGMLMWGNKPEKEDVIVMDGVTITLLRGADNWVIVDEYGSWKELEKWEPEKPEEYAI